MAIGMPHANPPCYFRDGPPAGGPGACSASYRLATSSVSRCRSTCRDTSVVSASIRWLPVPRRSSSTAELARVALRPTRMRCAPSSDPSLRTGRPDRPQAACEWSYRPWHVGDSRRHPKTPHSSTRALDLMIVQMVDERHTAPLADRSRGALHLRRASRHPLPRHCLPDHALGVALDACSRVVAAARIVRRAPPSTLRMMSWKWSADCCPWTKRLAGGATAIGTRTAMRAHGRVARR